MIVKNNKGYMLVEIVVAFAIAVFIVIFLQQITVMLKNKEEDFHYTTVFSSDKALMTKEVMDDVNDYKVVNVNLIGSSCEPGYNCVDITYKISDTNEQIKRLAISIADKKFKYGVIKENSGVWNWDTSSYVYEKNFDDSLTLSWELSPTLENKIFKLKLSAKTMYSDEDYGIYLVIPIAGTTSEYTCSDDDTPDVCEIKKEVIAACSGRGIQYYYTEIDCYCKTINGSNLSNCDDIWSMMGGFQNYEFGTSKFMYLTDVRYVCLDGSHYVEDSSKTGSPRSCSQDTIDSCGSVKRIPGGYFPDGSNMSSWYFCSS